MFVRLVCSLIVHMLLMFWQHSLLCARYSFVHRNGCGPAERSVLNPVYGQASGQSVVPSRSCLQWHCADDLVKESRRYAGSWQQATASPPYTDCPCNWFGAAESDRCDPMVFFFLIFISLHGSGHGIIRIVPVENWFRLLHRADHRRFSGDVSDVFESL